MSVLLAPLLLPPFAVEPPNSLAEADPVRDKEGETTVELLLEEGSGGRSGGFVGRGGAVEDLPSCQHKHGIPRRIRT